MRNFIRPWRRKAGVMVLGLACLFTVGWVRSFYWFELAWIPFSQTSTIQFSSMLSRFSLMRLSEPHQLKYTTFEKAGDHYLTLLTAESSYRVCGVRFFSKLDAYHVDTAGIVVPYWMPVVLMTLLAAYLLLSKPRSSMENQSRRKNVGSD